MKSHIGFNKETQFLINLILKDEIVKKKTYIHKITGTKKLQQKINLKNHLKQKEKYINNRDQI